MAVTFNYSANAPSQGLTASQAVACQGLDVINRSGDNKVPNNATTTIPLTVDLTKLAAIICNASRDCTVVFKNSASVTMYTWSPTADLPYLTWNNLSGLANPFEPGGSVANNFATVAITVPAGDDLTIYIGCGTQP